MDNIRKYISICETIYFDILVERLATRLEHFNPDKYVNMYSVDSMNGFEFEDFLVKIFQTLGYDVKETKRTQDQGADLFVTRFDKNIVIQAKTILAQLVIQQYNKPSPQRHFIHVTKQWLLRTHILLIRLKSLQNQQKYVLLTEMNYRDILRIIIKN